LGTLFTCPHCAAVYFINWNGEAEVANHEEEPIADSFSPQEGFVPPFAQESEQSAETNYGQIEQPQSYEPQSTEAELNYQEIQPADGFETNEPNEPAPAPMEEIPFDFSQTLDQAPQEVPQTSTVSDDANFADVLDFANTNTSAGPLSYVVVIEGIESSQLVHALREAMTDSRFGWDVHELLTHIGGGRLVLKGLTPAKASVLINRIKYLPFKISWRQDVLSSS
jgi:hypothetical protein